MINIPSTKRYIWLPYSIFSILGNRLAFAAGAIAYGDKKVVYSGPVYSRLERNRNKKVVYFTNTGKGVISSDGNALKHFAIAGDDKNFRLGKR
ncbi:MAG: hypothetical protein H7Y31_03500 [Chitinophagaceae bacterium]|nr:hypothetical protein [Chitinophagaceae bacterium]